MKLYTNRTWLYRRYVVEHKSAAEIAKIAGTTEMTIDRWLDKYGFKRNRRTWSDKRK